MASDFMKPWYFVWYSAGARLSTLYKIWLVDKRKSDKTTIQGKHYVEYKINNKWINFVKEWRIYINDPYWHDKK